MSAPTPVPARLFVLLAREAPVGVIVRRGPSDWVQLIHWDTKKDIFTPGQWFHGKVYTDRSDLSPDGSLMIYFASKYTGERIRERKAVWTAISKPPYFTALKIWFHDSTYGGGGLFEDQNRVWLRNFGHGSIEILRPELQAKKSAQLTESKIAYHGVLYYRLERDGWNVIERTNTKWAIPRQWQKSLGNVTLTQYYWGYDSRHGGTLYAYSVSHEGRPGIELDGARWADFDQQKRLVLAKEGKLFSAAMKKGELSLTELVDFNANKHEPVETPGWAQKW